MSTVVGLFRQYENAERAMDDLLANRFEMNEISAIVPESARRGAARTAPTAGEVPPLATASSSNAPVGNPGILGLGGAIAGLKGTAMPGLGTVRTTGPLLSDENPNTVKAGDVGRKGDLAGALASRGIPEADAEVYAEGIRRGHVLLAVDTDRVSDVKSIMNQNNVADPVALAKGWEHEGWRPGRAG